MITSFCHRVGEKVCADYSGSLDKYSPFDSPTSQFNKLAFPELTDDCIQNPPLLIAAPSLRFISAQDSAGNSGIEPRGTRGKIKKIRGKKEKKEGREKIKTVVEPSVAKEFRDSNLSPNPKSLRTINTYVPDLRNLLLVTSLFPSPHVKAFFICDKVLWPSLLCSFIQLTNVL